MLLILLAPAASAFCGTFVGGTDANLINHSSQVVLVRQGTHTTLTVAADFEGDAADFGLLLPVPEVLTAEDVQVVDPALIQALDLYSTPRAVTYRCEDFFQSSESDGLSTPPLGCFASTDYMIAKDASGGMMEGDPADSSVEVQSQFAVANYEIVVLSAEESADLTTWLSNHDYAMPVGGEEILQSYIDAGSFFLAAKVSIEPEGETTWLPPLQFSYDSEVFGLPIRIGTISSDGEQEVVIYTITESAQVAIANYPEVQLENDCMYNGGSLQEYYADAVDEALSGGAGWILEHSWDLGQSCDPCTAPDPFTTEQIGDLGFEGADTGHYGSYMGHLTRLRVRYSPEEATQDLVLYESGANQQDQMKFIVYNEDMEALFPVCGEGMVDDPGTCEPEAACAVVAPSVAGRQVFGAGMLALVASLLRLRRVAK